MKVGVHKRIVSINHCQFSFAACSHVCMCLLINIGILSLHSAIIMLQWRDQLETDQTDEKEKERDEAKEEEEEDKAKEEEEEDKANKEEEEDEAKEEEEEDVASEEEEDEANKEEDKAKEEDEVGEEEGGMAVAIQ